MQSPDSSSICPPDEVFGVSYLKNVSLGYVLSPNSILSPVWQRTHKLCPEGWDWLSLLGVLEPIKPRWYDTTMCSIMHARIQDPKVWSMWHMHMRTRLCNSVMQKICLSLRHKLMLLQLILMWTPDTRLLQTHKHWRNKKNFRNLCCYSNSNRFLAIRSLWLQP